MFRSAVSLLMAISFVVANGLNAEAISVRAPLSGQRVTSDFGIRIHPVTGKRSFHAGIDLAAKLNQVVSSVVSGVVTRAGRRGPLGNSVEVLNAESRIETIFGHLNSVSVRVGDRVKAGDVIGYAGSTGRSTGVHLHLVVKNAKTGKLINPRDLLNKKRLSVAKEAPKQNGPRSNSKVNIEKLASNTAAKRRAQDKEKLLATQKQEAQLHIDLAAASQKAEQYRALYQEGAVSRNDMQEKEREVEHLEDQLNRIRRIASI